MEDVIFEMNMKVDKNSWEFDLGLLEELKALKNIPVNKFNTVVRNIMKKKSSCKLWFNDNTVDKWDGKKSISAVERTYSDNSRENIFRNMQLSIEKLPKQV